MTSTYRDHRAFAQAGQASPFRSTDADTREMAALAMATQRARELASLEAALATATGSMAKKALRLRIKATKNNAASWTDYEAQGCYREDRAVMTPVVRPNPLVVA